MSFLRFFHYLGFALWMGGGWATMALVIRSRRDTPAARAGLFRILPAAFGVMAIGAVVTVFSGLGLAWMLSRLGLGARMGETGIIIMQGSGLLAAVMLLAMAAPAVRKISKLALTEPLPAEVERLRKRMAIASSVAGGLGLLALAGVTLL
jgi:hypothetical protein